MFQIDHTTAVTDMPTPSLAGAPGFFTAGNPVAGLPATIVTADWLNILQRELINILAMAGVTPDKTKYDQIAASIAKTAGVTVWSADFAKRIGGYSQGAIVADPGNVGVYWCSGADNNLSSPGSDGSNWVNLFSGYAPTSALSDYIKNSDAITLAQHASLDWSSVGISLAISRPVWATRLETWSTGAGGAAAGINVGQDSGSSTYNYASSGGGGAGATLYAMLSVASAESINIIAGSGGTSGNAGNAGTAGGNSTVSIDGQIIVTAGGGDGTAWSTKQQSAGGSGGTATINVHDRVLNYIPLTGGSGSDGQTGSLIFAGAGGASYWGGGGRAGNGGGGHGNAPGSGGGGAYSTAVGNSGSGGAGANGIVVYRFLP